MNRVYIYTTRNSALFFQQDEGNYYTDFVEITGIRWDNQSSVGRCQYCGHDYTGEECPGCAARRKDKVALTGLAYIDMRGYAHPETAWMMSLPRHLELHYTNCGRVSVFENWDWRIIFENCATIGKEVGNPNSFTEDEAVMFYVKFKADVLIQYENPKTGWQLIP